MRYLAHSNSHPRFSIQVIEFRFFRFLFFTLMAAGFAIAPFRIAAQEAAPATQSQPAAAASETAKPEAAQSEDEQQNNAFRLEGPVVKWTAKTFHTSLETAATLFEWANFAVIFFGIGIPLFKFLPKFLRQRGEKVQADIESARKVTEDANARLSAVEARRKRSCSCFERSTAWNTRSDCTIRMICAAADTKSSVSDAVKAGPVARSPTSNPRGILPSTIGTPRNADTSSGPW